MKLRPYDEAEQPDKAMPLIKNIILRMPYLPIWRAHGTCGVFE